MNLFFYPIIFLFGLAVGSFLNCIIYRLKSGESFLKGRSYCPHCKHILNWKDLIPVLSFIILKGKCRYCQKKISWQYPLAELATGTLFVLITTYNLQLTTYDLRLLLNLGYHFFVVCCLLIIFVYDFRHYIIPDKIIYPAIIITSLYSFSQLAEVRLFQPLVYFVEVKLLQILSFQPLVYSIFSAILASGFFLTIVLISKGKWMGFGDVKLALFMGLFLGWPNILVALFFAFFLGAIIGIGLILAKKKTLKSEVPFGPFLVTGTFIAFFLGNTFIDWYSNFLMF